MCTNYVHMRKRKLIIYATTIYRWISRCHYTYKYLFPWHFTTWSSDSSSEPWRTLLGNNSVFLGCSPPVPSPLAFLALQQVGRELIAADQLFFAERTRLLLDAKVDPVVTLLTNIEHWGGESLTALVAFIFLEWRLEGTLAVIATYECLLDWTMQKSFDSACISGMFVGSSLGP